jgi:putative tricarboxylic transport membrane protein
VLADWLQGFLNLLGYQELLFLATGIAIGLFVGILPGIGGTTALILLTPLTFALDPVQALALAGGIMGAVPMGGAVTAILLNTPGQTANAVTCLDGYPLAQQGKAGLAIGAAASSNALGGLVGAVSILAVIPLANELVMLFGPPELFLLAMIGLVLVATSSRGGRMFRAILSALVGLGLATVGYSDLAGSERYTFGSEYLWDGVHLGAALIGLFAVAEMVHLTVKGGSVAKADAPVAITGMMDGLLASFRHWRTLLRGSIIGTFAGVVPGVGGTVASFLSYSLTVQASKEPETFGKGNVQGIIATEAAINAKDGSMLVPTLAFGIPGTPEMAVFMSILVLHGMQPGPLMLLKNREEIYSLVWALTAACLIASLIGLLLARPLAGLTRVDVHILAPLIIALSFAGSFAIDLELGNLIVTAAFGVLGYLMIVLNYPRLPLVIGIVLGGVAERTFLQSMMISDGDISIFVNRTTCQVLLAGMAAAFLWPRLMKRLGGRRQVVGLAPAKTLGDRR